MNRKIPEAIRLLVAHRAGYRCEYCRIPFLDGYAFFQIDHIISWKHGGFTDLKNLACACIICNRNKGSDLGTVLEIGGAIVRFFNPRNDNWFDHFELLDSGLIVPKTNVGEATSKILQFNHVDSLIARKLLMDTGSF